MADTVKKSRIVSDDEPNLEEAFLEEFNSRLKSMSNDNLLQQDVDDPPDDQVNDIYESVISGSQKCPKNDIIATERFLNREIRHENLYDEPKCLLNNSTNQNNHLLHNDIYENIRKKTENLDQNYVKMTENNIIEINNKCDKQEMEEEYEPMGLDECESNIYESVEIKVPPQTIASNKQVITPLLNLPTTSFSDYSEQKSPDTEQKSSSVKDRMLLSCDDTSTLLFTQTVTSPMLTPSEENIDFLKGFRRENTNSESTPTTSNNVSEKEIGGNNETSPDVTEPLDEEQEKSTSIQVENFYENTAFYKNTTPENTYENIKIEEEHVYEHLANEEDIYQNVDEILSKDNKIDELKGAGGCAGYDTDDGSLEEFIRNEREASESFNELSTQKEALSNRIHCGAESKKAVDSIVSKTNNEKKAVIKTSSYHVDDIDSHEDSSSKKSPIEETKTSQTNTKETKERISTETYKELIYHQKLENNSNYYEKYTELLTKCNKENVVICNREKDTETVPAEIVKNLKCQFMNKGNIEATSVTTTVATAPVTTTALMASKDRPNNKLDMKSANTIINQIKTKFESDAGDDETNNESSEYSETIVESNAPGERCIKKKKVKRTRKEEKENISVPENGNVDSKENYYYNVNVKSLCRSFGDLTNIGRNANNRTRTRSLTDMKANHNNIENVFAGVSVKMLKERFNNGGISKKCFFENDSLKSSFSKFDALQKKNVLHIRSTDSTKAQEKFSNGVHIDISTNCKACNRQVFQMEQIKAEKALWHKNCFRCIECSKQLTVDAYESNEGSLYCKPHFKALFAPKAVEDDGSPKQRKHEPIIRENQPAELPPDVVRASDKPDLGLEELQSLNVKERFQVFEQYQQQIENNENIDRGGTPVKRSPSILSKLAKFQKHGMDIGVSNEALDGIPVEESSSEEEEEEEIAEGEDVDLVRAKRVQKEKPFHFTAMLDVKKKWEHGDHTREERREETKQEIQNIRNRLFLGKQEKMKEAYQQAILDCESGTVSKKNVTEDIEVCDTKSIKERFEKGEVANEKIIRDNRNDEEEIYESELSKKSRSLFLELDASASKPPQITPVTPPKLEVKKAREAYLAKTASEDTVKSTEQIEEIEVKTADIQERFKFFETYKEPEKQKKEFRMTPPRDPSQVKTETPDREIYHDPDVIRSEEYIDDSKIAQETHTASKMLNKFRQMEENLGREPEPAGPKPLKCFTPPPEPARVESHSEAEESSEYEEEEEEDDVDNASKLPVDLVEAQKAARAKQLRAKFEKWEANEIKKEQQNAVNIVEEIAISGEDQSQIETTRVLRAKFESLRESSNNTETSTKTQRVKPNRFVEMPIITNTEICQSCNDKVYPLEKLSIHGNIYHKNCFKCMECSCVLRMDSYSYNQGLLYCTPHFKRLFITKGNYDSAFGLDRHKEKWQSNINNMTMA